jgi:hypothetical protein
MMSFDVSKMTQTVVTGIEWGKLHVAKLTMAVVEGPITAKPWLWAPVNRVIGGGR